MNKNNSTMNPISISSCNPFKVSSLILFLTTSLLFTSCQGDPKSHSSSSSPDQTSDALPIEWPDYQPSFDPKQPLGMTLFSGNPFNIVEPGKEDQLFLVFNNTTSRSVSIDLSISIKDASYLPTKYIPQEPVTASPQSQTKWPVPQKMIGKLGIKYLEYQIQVDGRKRQGRHTFAYMKPVGPTKGHSSEEPFIFGNSGAENLLQIQASALIGSKSIRHGMYWHIIQKSENSWDWDKYDLTVDQAAKYGIDIQALLAYCPGWARSPKHGKPNPGGWFLSSPPRIDAWQRFTAEIGKRYKDKIKYWEVWNEPDLGFWNGSDEEYLELLKTGYIELKKADPNCLVMTGGFGDSQHAGRNNPHLFDKMLAGYSDYFDMVAYHRHSNFMTFRPELDNYILPRFKKYNIDEPLVFNETSMARGYETEHEVGEEYVKRMVYAWSKGAKGYYIFKIVDVPSGQKGLPITRYGIMNSDFSPRPAYVAYNTTSRYLRKKEFITAFPLQGDQHAYLFGKGDQWTVTFWKENKGESDQVLALSVSPNAKAYTVDLMGNKTPVSNQNGTLLFQTQPVPQFLVVEGSSSQPTFNAPFLSVPNKILNSPGKPAQITLHVQNPYSEKIEKNKFQLQIQDPEQIAEASSLKTQTLQLTDNKKQTIPLSFMSSASFRRSEDKIPSLRLHYQLPAFDISGTMTVPISMAYSIPKGDDWNRPADFTLNQYDDVVNLYENLPQTDHLNWQGPQDLSAQIWLGRKDQKLLLRVITQDDVYKPQPIKGKTWQGDSVQFAFAIPGATEFKELTLAHLGEGKNIIYTALSSGGHPLTGNDPASSITVQTQSEPGKVIYNLEIPYSYYGFTDELLNKGILFNLLVNDNDTGKREGWVRVAPGLGKGGKRLAPFPIVVFE